MKLISIPKDKYRDYRLDLMFDCYKWDPQFLDNNTIAKYALVITEEEHKQLKKLTEQLDKETREAEEFLNKNLEFTKILNLPFKIHNEIKTMKNYNPNIHIRLMRFDFHPTYEGFKVSEVNSDVPGGFAEASLMPEIAQKLLGKNKYDFKNFGEILTSSILKKVKSNGKIMLVHCTCFSDDRQVMQFLGDKLQNLGFNIIYGASDHIRFKNNEAYSILSGNEGKLDGIIRFTPIEWLMQVKPKFWQGYFNTITPSCNHPIAIFAQTKRFPLIWKKLEEQGLVFNTWKKLLPKTMQVNGKEDKEKYIYKPVYGRVGEKISIKEACEEGEYDKILKDVKKHPNKYIAQEKFESRPLVGDDNEEFHLCLGSYVIDGKHAGYYGRISKTRRIDSNAADIPVLIERNKNDG